MKYRQKISYARMELLSNISETASASIIRVDVTHDATAHLALRANPRGPEGTWAVSQSHTIHVV